MSGDYQRLGRRSVAGGARSFGSDPRMAFGPAGVALGAGVLHEGIDLQSAGCKRGAHSRSSEPMTGLSQGNIMGGEPSLVSLTSEEWIRRQAFSFVGHRCSPRGTFACDRDGDATRLQHCGGGEGIWIDLFSFLAGERQHGSGRRFRMQDGASGGVIGHCIAGRKRTL